MCALEFAFRTKNQMEQSCFCFLENFIFLGRALLHFVDLGNCNIIFQCVCFCCLSIWFRLLFRKSAISIWKKCFCSFVFNFTAKDSFAVLKFFYINAHCIFFKYEKVFLKNCFSCFLWRSVFLIYILYFNLHFVKISTWFFIKQSLQFWNDFLVLSHRF